jgi:hypothetical protein
MPKSLNLTDVAAIAGLVAVAAIALGGAYKVASRPPEPADARELGRIVRQVASIARNAAVTAKASGERRATDAYSRTHQEKLAEDLDAQREKLDVAFAAGVRKQAEGARELTTELSQVLKELKRHIGEPDALAQTSAAARRIAEDIARLEPPA